MQQIESPTTAPTTEKEVQAPSTLDEQISEIIKYVKKDDKGRLIFPDNLSPEIEYAARSEYRRRDTQSEYTKAKHNLRKLEAERQQLLDELSANPSLSLTKDEAEELEVLKYSDPDAWRSKLAEVEKKQREKRELALQEASSRAQLEEREVILKEFIQKNPGFNINDDVIANDLPPRITNKLANGELSFEDFLVEARNYLEKGVTLNGSSAPNMLNLSLTGGDSQPGQQAMFSSMVDSYEQEIY